MQSSLMEASAWGGGSRAGTFDATASAAPVCKNSRRSILLLASRGLMPFYQGMSTLKIDGRSIVAVEGQTILDAARSAGIEIPTLCWYPKLPIVGNCRICLVSVEGQAKLIAACATKVADGMVVTTQSHAAVENRRGVLRL